MIIHSYHRLSLPLNNNYFVNDDAYIETQPITT